MTEKLFSGSCHCGAVHFEVSTELEPATRCNCSMCVRKGAAMSAPFATDKLRILSGEDALTVYQFNKRIARHYFCKHCGIYPFHQMARDKNLWRVNLGCLDGVDPYALACGVANGAAFPVVEAT